MKTKLLVIAALLATKPAFAAGFGCWIDEKVPVSLNDLGGYKEVILTPDASSPRNPHIALTTNNYVFSIWEADMCRTNVEIKDQQGETVFTLQTSGATGTAWAKLPGLVLENARVECPCGL